LKREGEEKEAKRRRDKITHAVWKTKKHKGGELSRRTQKVIKRKLLKHKGDAGGKTRGVE